MLLMIASSPLSATSVVSPGSVDNQRCTNLIIPKIQSLESNIDTSKALALAKGSQEFQTISAGHENSFSGISDLSTFDPATCGEVAIAEVSINFILEDVALTTTGGAQIHASLQVFEDAGLTHVNGVKVDEGGFTTNDIVSGYQVHYDIAGVTQNLIASGFTFTQPSISYVAECNPSANPVGCDTAIWAGLYNNDPLCPPYGNCFLAQTGTDGKITCSSTPPYACGTVAYYGWWQFVPSGPVTCSTSSYVVSVGDSLSPSVENGLDWFGGSSNQWETFLSDTTAGWICSSGVHTDTHTSTNWADTMFERGTVCGSGANQVCHLAKFNSGSSVVTNSNQFCYGSLGTSITCKLFNNGLLDPWYMNKDGNVLTCANPPNPLGANICLVSVDTNGRFSETWYTSAGT